MERPQANRPIDRPLSDSGERVESVTGYMKEPDGVRKDYSWVFELEGFELVPREMIERMAAHLVKGAKKYSPENWRLGTDVPSLMQFRRSLSRHIFQWFRGESDEDHAAAVTFNLWAHEINKDANPNAINIEIHTPAQSAPIVPAHGLPTYPPGVR